MELSVMLLMNSESHLPNDVDRQHLPGLSTRCDAYLQPLYGYLLLAQSEGGQLAIVGQSRPNIR